MPVTEGQSIHRKVRNAAVLAASVGWWGRQKHLELDALRSRWEAMWVAFDFSWEGLADAGWDNELADESQRLKRWRAPQHFPGGGETHRTEDGVWKEASLQDYWRWSLGYCVDKQGSRLLSDDELQEAGLLIRASDGKLWHRLHLDPSSIPDGNSVENYLYDSVLDRDGREILVKDGALEAMILARLSSSGEKSENKADLALNLTGARAAGLGNFLNLCFRASLAFKSDRPMRINARCASLDHFKGSGVLSFGESHFEFAYFAGAANFSRINFSGEVGFAHAYFAEGASFIHTHFENLARFDNTHFANAAMFSGAKFFGMASFHNSHFDDLARFPNTWFADEASFRQAHFSNWVEFPHSHFGGATRFDDAYFADAAWFEDCHFEGKAGFVNVEFANNRDGGPLWFRTTCFSKLADFSGCCFPSEPARVEGAFETARFIEEARFLNTELSAFAAFDGAVLKGKLLLAAAESEIEEQRRFNTVLRNTEAAVCEGRWIPTSSSQRPVVKDLPKKVSANARFAALEGGLRVLKTAMVTEKDHMQEHRFFRFELQAKRRRPSVSRLEKMASWGYGLLSDYGNSMGRPLAALGLSVLLLWVVYWVWGLSLDPSFLGVEKERTALEFSIRNVVQPFSPWTATTRSTLFELDIVKIVSCGKPAETACPSGGGIGWLVFRLLATLQSVFSLLLAFLFALALRKKFQIS